MNFILDILVGGVVLSFVAIVVVFCYWFVTSFSVTLLAIIILTLLLSWVIGRLVSRWMPL
jgi:hypothetical protein